MKAQCLFDKKKPFAGGMLRMVVWSVPEPVDPSLHGFKYRLVYIVDGVSVVGYDNERGKGDHKHLGAEEFVYAFVGLDQLVADFLADVRRAK